jgi:hypothetical protein
LLAKIQIYPCLIRRWLIGYYSGIGGLVGTIFERSAVDSFWIVDSLETNLFFAKVGDAGIV